MIDEETEAEDGVENEEVASTVELVVNVLDDSAADGEGLITR